MVRLADSVCDLRKPIATFRFVGLLGHACFQVSTHTTRAAMDLQNGTPMRYSKILALPADYFRLNDYYTLGTGKLLHHMVRGEWKNFGNRADYGPFAYDGKDNQPHPDTPAPYNEIGPVDGSFGPLVNIEGRTTKDGVTHVADRWVAIGRQTDDSSFR